MSFNVRAASEQGLLRPSHKLSTEQGGKTMISSQWAALDRAVFNAPINSGIYRLILMRVQDEPVYPRPGGQAPKRLVIASEPG